MGPVIAWRQRKLQFIISPQVAEAFVVKCGVDLALSLGLHDVIIKSDYLVLTKVINSNMLCLAAKGHIVEEIKTLSSLFNYVVFTHVFRSANCLAHDLSKSVVSNFDGWADL